MKNIVSIEEPVRGFFQFPCRFRFRRVRGRGVRIFCVGRVPGGQETGGNVHSGRLGMAGSLRSPLPGWAHRTPRTAADSPTATTSRPPTLGVRPSSSHVSKLPAVSGVSLDWAMPIVVNGHLASEERKEAHGFAVSRRLIALSAHPSGLVRNPTRTGWLNISISFVVIVRILLFVWLALSTRPNILQACDGLGHTNEKAEN